VASIGLVIVTGGLVYVTSQLSSYTGNLVTEAKLTRDEMASARAEMTETRLLGIRPHILIEVIVASPTYGLLGLRNVGPGYAKELRMAIAYEPLDIVREWAWPVLAPGEAHQFILPDPIVSLDSAEELGLVAAVTGSFSDILGESYRLDQRFEFAPWWAAAKQAFHRYEQPPLAKLVQFAERAAKALEKH
jgi:hypothetical protein